MMLTTSVLPEATSFSKAEKAGAEVDNFFILSIVAGFRTIDAFINDFESLLINCIVVGEEGPGVLVDRSSCVKPILFNEGGNGRIDGGTGSGKIFFLSGR